VSALILIDDERDRRQALAHRARSQPALARRARVLLSCAQGLDNKTIAENAYLAGHGGQVVCKLVWKDSTTSPDLGPPQGQRCRGRASGDSDLGKHAARRNALEHARFGQS
jgi:hypothetical protein